MRGKAKLFVRYEDGTRKSVVLPYAWVRASARDIQTSSEQIAKQVATGLSLSDAADRVLGRTNGHLPARPASPGGDLLGAWERFGQFKVHGTGQVKPSTWDKDYGATGRRLGELSTRDMITAKQLLSEVGACWDPGSRCRQIAVQQVAAMLRWAVEENLLKQAFWSPPQNLKLFIGERTKPTQAAIPFSDQHILDLLDGLPTDAAGLRWRYAIQLCSVFGLRPVELLHLSPRPDGKIWCNYSKRSGGGTTKPRWLEPFHPHWAQEWSIIERIHSNEPLPPLESKAGPADVMRKYLRRQNAWLALTEHASEKYTPYSFRHGYALRLHRHYPKIHTRFVAALMGHSHDTHLNCYGQWTDADTLEASIQTGIQQSSYRPVAMED